MILRSMNKISIVILIILNLSACNYTSTEKASNRINFSGLYFNGKQFLIGDSEKSIEQKNFQVSQTENCRNYIISDQGLDLLYKDNQLISILINYHNKDVATSHGIKNGMTGKDIYKQYEDFKIIKEPSEGAGDSQDDFIYTIHDKENKLKNEIVFDVVNGEIMGIHVSQKGLDGYICDQ